MKCLATISAACVLFFSVIVSAATAEPAKPGRPIAHKIAHGSEITAANVGPAAAGFGNLKQFEGGEIKDGNTYPFVTEIAVSTNYDGFEVKGPHRLIECAAFSKSLDISTTLPVVMRGSSVRAATASPWAVLVRPGAGAFYFLWSDAGALTTDGAPNDRSHAMSGALQLRGPQAVVFRSHISKTSDGIDVSGSAAVVQETLIDELTAWAGDHNDGIQIAVSDAANGAKVRRQIQVVRSKILNPNPQTSGLYILGDGVTLRDNFFAGGGWTIYGGAKSNGHGGASSASVTASNNIFGRGYFPKSGHFGPVTYWDKSPALANTWTDNRFEDGKPVTP